MNYPDNSFFDEKDLLILTKEFCIEGADSVQPVYTGVINNTFVVGSSSTNQKYILQRLHKIFSFDLLHDIEAVTSHLALNGILTPRLINTRNGLPGIEKGHDIWRMMTYINGRTVIKASCPLAESAGTMLARYHKVFVGFDYKFKHKIPGFHDTESSIKRLISTKSKFSSMEKYKQLEDLIHFVSDQYDKKVFDLSGLPNRLVHGDPKLSNFLFDNTEDKAMCIVDLDTFSNDNVAVELGDAVRSFCHMQDVDSAPFNKDIFAAFIGGYMSAADFLTNREISDIIKGVKYVTLDLCARYITDAYEEKYFKLDSSKYSSLYEQNSVKASNLVSFYNEINKNEQQLNDLVKNCCSN
jgi:Ser/Thr protein kinase RdoA (MazF antagonist)